MSVIVGSYDPEFFNLIPEYSSALTLSLGKQSADVIDHLGKVFVRHNTYKKYGLIMIHRHFPMSKDEILVENINENHSLSVAIPWKLDVNTGTASPCDISYWKSFGFKEEQNLSILPQSWAYDNSTPGHLQPFEFIATNEIEDPPPSAFVYELYEELKNLGLLNIFGLRRTRQNRSSYETTPSGVRANVIKYGKIPLEMNNKIFVKVIFLIDEFGRSNFGLWCGECSSLCQTHNHTDAEA